MSAFLTNSEDFCLSVLWCGSLGLAAMSLVLACILIVMHIRKESAYRLYQKKKERAQQIVKTCIFGQANMCHSDQGILRLDDFDAVVEVATEWLRNFSGQQAENLLGMLHFWGVQAYLLKAINEGSQAQKTSALVYCGYDRSSETLELLVKGCYEMDQGLQLIALRGLAMRGQVDKLFQILNETELKHTHSILVLTDIFVLLGTDGGPYLLDLVKSKQVAHELLLASIMALGYIRALAAVDPFLERLSEDLTIDMRAQIIAALGRIGDQRAQRAILEAMDHEAVAVRVNAVHAASHLKSSLFVQKLNDLLYDPAWWVRFRAAETLGKMQSLGINILDAACALSGDADGLACGILAENRKVPVT